MVMLHASFGRMNAYIIQSAWAFFVAYPCTVGNAKAWKCGISDRYSSHAIFLLIFSGGEQGEESCYN